MSLSDELWNAINAKKYDDAFNLVKKNPVLINAINPATNTSLAGRLLRTQVNRPEDFLKYVLAAPTLDLNYVKPDTIESILGMVLSSERPDYVNCIRNNPGIVTYESKLTYETSKNRVSNAKLYYQTSLKKGVDSESKMKMEIRIKDLEEILKIVRDASIRYAIKTDNCELFDKLEAAGAEPSSLLSDDTRPRTLLGKEQPNPNLNAWFESKLKRFCVGVNNNPNSLFNTQKRVEALQTQLAQEKVDYTIKQAEIVKQGAGNLMNSLANLSK